MAEAQPSATGVILGRVATATTHVEDPSCDRLRLCETAAVVFGCAAAGHAWLDLEQRAWTVSLWRWGAAGAETKSLVGVDPGMRGDALTGWWPRSECRHQTIEWVGGPCIIEVPFDGSSVLVLGRGNALAPDDLRLVSMVLAQLAVIGRSMLQLESPGPFPSEAFTMREVEVLRLLSAGLIARSIAHRMSVSERTVHKHLEHLYSKLQVHDRLSAVIRAQQLGLLASAATA